MVFAVDILESERGWGQKVDSTVYFDDRDYKCNADKALLAAKKYVTDYNKSNNAPVVPDWYMMALEPRMVSMESKEIKQANKYREDQLKRKKTRKKS